MRLISRSALALAAFAVVATVARPLPARSAGDFEASPLYTRMTAVNAGLKSYKARVHVDVVLKTFPYLRPSLDGTAYYKAPDRSAIDFDSVPMFSSMLKNVFPRLPAPAQWPRLFTMAQISSEDGRTLVRLTPRKHGRVDHLDVTIDDAKAMPVGYTYAYTDGGTVHFDETIANAHGFALVSGLTGTVDLPSYKGDAAAVFRGYQVNVPVDDAKVDAPPAR